MTDIGDVDVVVIGEVIERLGSGHAFGEIGLLREMPRTATIIATAPHSSWRSSATSSSAPSPAMRSRAT